MIRTVGRVGPLKVAGLVLWELRYTLLAILITVGCSCRSRTPRRANTRARCSRCWASGPRCSSPSATPPPTTGGGGPHLWGGIIINSRTLSNGLTSIDPDRRRSRDHRPDAAAPGALLLATGRRDAAHPAAAGVVELTEDPADADAVDLLNRQATDIQNLVADGYIDAQAWLLLMNSNTGAATAQSGLERVRNEPCRCTTTCSSGVWPGSSGSWRSAGWTAPPTRRAVSRSGRC